MKYIAIILSFFLMSSVYAQETVNINNYRKRAKLQVRQLKEDGALVLRLILHKKNADLYRQAGKVKLADKLERTLKNRNQVLAKVFLDESFDFCKVYIIEAKDYKRVLSGEKSGYFLNQNLEIDSSIELTTDIIYFMEVGNVYEVQSEIGGGEKKTVYGATPLVQDVLIVKDRNMNQLLDPFPYYVRLSTLNTNLKDISINVTSNNHLDYDNSYDYVAYIKEKFKFKKPNLVLASRAYYINKRLTTFYFRALNKEEKKNFK